MIKLFYQTILFVPCLILADDFETYLKIFFIDSVFQKSHVSYPIPGYYSYICDSNSDGTCEKDTIFARDSKGWDYKGYGYGAPGVVYKKSDNCPRKLPKETNCIYVELSEPDTDFNLQLYFKKVKDTWNLIYLWYFEP